MWAIARYDLRLSNDEFGRLTPRQFHALRKRQAFRDQRDDYRFAVLASVMANLQRDPKARAKPWGPADFFDVEEVTGAGSSERGVMSPEHILAAFQTAIMLGNARKGYEADNGQDRVSATGHSGERGQGPEGSGQG